MLEFWKRKEAELAMRWGMSDFESVRASVWSLVLGHAQDGAITFVLHLCHVTCESLSLFWAPQLPGIISISAVGLLILSTSMRMS